jgi:hypothetical protein
MRRMKMDLPRKLGIGIVMIVPAFVGSGALWAMFHHAVPILIWVAIMLGTAGGIVSGKLTRN